MNTKILLLLVVVALATASPTRKVGTLEESGLDKRDIASKVFQGVILPKLLSELKQFLPTMKNHNSVKIQDLSLLGGFNLSLAYDSGNFPGYRSFGFASAQDIALHGASEIVDKFTVTFNNMEKTATLTWKAASSGHVRLDGNYQLSSLVEIDFCLYGQCWTAGLPSSGLGKWFIDLKAPKVDIVITMSLPTTGKVGVVGYDGVLDLASAGVSFEKYTDYSGHEFTPEEWVLVSEGVKDLVDETNKADVRPGLNEQWRCVLDHVINGCTLVDLINLNWDCLKPEIKTECAYFG